MIGKSLRERYDRLLPLTGERAVAIVEERLATQGPALIQVRAQDPRMIACLIVRADRIAVRACRELGLAMRLGGTGVVGLLGADAARCFAPLPTIGPAWLEAPCGPRETKVLLVARGIALLSVEAVDGKVRVTAVA